MSREVDPKAKNLSDDDKLHLAQRGLLPEDVMSVEDQRKALDPEANVVTLEQLANTGTVNTAGLSIEELEAELEKRRAEAAAVDHAKLFGSQSGAAPDEDDEEALVPPYDQYTKDELLAEIGRRNDELDPDEEPMPLAGTKVELVARLEEDDATDDDDD